MVAEKQTKMEKAIDDVDQAVRDHIKTDRREHCLMCVKLTRNENRHGNIVKVRDLMSEIDSNANRWLSTDKAAKVKIATAVVREIAIKVIAIKAEKEDEKQAKFDAERAKAVEADKKAKEKAAEEAEEAQEKADAKKAKAEDKDKKEKTINVPDYQNGGSKKVTVT